MPGGDRRSVGRKLREELPNVVVEGEFPARGQEHEGHRGKLLRDRRDVEDRLRGDDRPLRMVGHTISPSDDQLAVPTDRDGAAGPIGAPVRSEDRIESTGRWDLGYRGQWQGEGRK